MHLMLRSIELVITSSRAVKQRSIHLVIS